MLSDLSTIRALVNRASLDPGVAPDLLSKSTSDRSFQREATTSFSSHYKPGATDTPELPTASTVKVVTALSHAVGIQALHHSLFTSAERGINPERFYAAEATIERQLPLTPGTYSVRVDYGSNDTSHALIDSSTATPALAAGSTLATASSLSPTNTPQAVSGFVGSAAADSYYRVTLDVTSNLNLSLGNLLADADLQLIRDANNNGVVDVGEVLATSSQPNVQPESIAVDLVAGTYFIHVYQYSGDTSYTLRTASTPLTLPSGYNATYGYGLVNADAVVGKALEQQSPTTPILSLDSNAWELNLVNAPTLWAKGYTGQGVVVAVVDTGVDSTHPDLKDNIWTNPGEVAGNGIDDDKNGFIDDINGWDFVDRDNTPLDLNSHGTHVAGAIAAERNDFGVTGVAYNAKIMPVRVIGLDGGSNLNVAAGIRYAADNGANVINLSLGGSASSAIVDAVQYATQKGSFVVMAAGNDGSSQPIFPANIANQWGIAVGAININKNLATFSARAGAVPLNYVVAPGVNVISTTPNNTYQSSSGTSMATPHVSGVAALFLSANPKLTPTQLTSLLTTNATAQGLTVA